MTSSSMKRQRTRKGKGPTHNDAVPPTQGVRFKTFLIIQDTLVQNVK